MAERLSYCFYSNHIQINDDGIFEKQGLVMQEPGKGKEHILIVDDEPSLVALQKMALQHLGYQVTTFTRSHEALECFRHNPDQFDMVLTDQTMPTLSGEELAKAMLSIRPDIPIVLLTGFSYTMNAEKAKAKAIGIRDFMIKPIEIEHMRATIRRILDAKSNTVIALKHGS